MGMAANGDNKIPRLIEIIIDKLGLVALTEGAVYPNILT